MATARCFTVLLVFLCVACAPSESQGGRKNHTPRLAVAQYEDLTKLARLLEEDSSFSPAALRAAHKKLAAMKAAAGTMSEAEFYLGTREISAFADNAHSFVLGWPVYEQFGTLPIRVVWFGDAAHIVRVKRELSPLLGARITEIAGRPIDEVITALSRYSGGPLRFERIFSSTNLMLSPALMQAAGLNPSENTMTLRIIHLDGVNELITLTAESPSTGYGEHPWMHAVLPDNKPWRYVMDAPIPGEDDAWMALLAADENLPIFLQSPDEAFRFIADIGNGVAYLSLRQNSDSDGLTMVEFLTGVADELVAVNPRHIILDMRLNSGGDLNTTFDFMSSVHGYLEDGGLVLSLIGPHTFSAGIYSAYFPKMANPSRTVVLGARVGDRPVFWSEGTGVVKLPHSGYLFTTARERHNLSGPCDDELCHINSGDERKVTIDPLIPDVPVSTSLHDVMTGHDPVVEAALEYIRTGARPVNL